MPFGDRIVQSNIIRLRRNMYYFSDVGRKNRKVRGTGIYLSPLAHKCTLSGGYNIYSTKVGGGFRSEDENKFWRYLISFRRLQSLKYYCNGFLTHVQISPFHSELCIFLLYRLSIQWYVQLSFRRISLWECNHSILQINTRRQRFFFIGKLKRSS